MRSVTGSWASIVASAAEGAPGCDEAPITYRAVAETLTAKGHSLRPIDDGKPDDGEFADVIEETRGSERRSTFASVMAGVWKRLRATTGGAGLEDSVSDALVLSLTLAWYVTPLADVGRPRHRCADWFKDAPIGSLGQALRGRHFSRGGLVAFPVIILIAATAAAFGPWLGFLYATLACWRARS